MGTIHPSAFIMGLGILGPALAIGIIGAAGLISMGRNPQNSDRIQQAMIVALAFAEAIAIYALIMALILKFV
ncbi:hypothetical protein BH09PAT2_BH09PAT2_02920 [soil metagenome]